MNLQSHIVLLTGITLGLCSCSGLHRTEPDWLANPKSVYPESRYLVAVGAGDTRRAAENAAAAHLARIFETRIRSDERLRDQSRETTDSFQRTTDFSSDISVRASETLYNIQHAEAWRDPDGRVHAVAYLERADTGALYREKMDQCADRIHELLARTEKADNDPIRRYAYLRAAQELAEEYTALLRQLNVIHPSSARTMALQPGLQRIGQACAEAAAHIRFSTELSGEAAAAILPALEKWITDYGFTTGPPPLLKMIGHVHIEDTGQRNAGLTFVRYELNVKIVDMQGRQLITLHEKGREAHVNLQEAKARALRTLEQAVRIEGRRLFNAYFDQQAAMDKAP